MQIRRVKLVQEELQPSIGQNTSYNLFNGSRPPTKHDGVLRIGVGMTSESLEELYCLLLLGLERYVFLDSAEYQFL